jgi:hypothetical protein
MATTYTWSTLTTATATHTNGTLPCYCWRCRGGTQSITVATCNDPMLAPLDIVIERRPRRKAWQSPYPGRR